MPRRVLSGMQPSGNMHLGNYFGAVKNWVALQEQKFDDTLYCVVDYHSITQAYQPEELRARSMEMTLDVMACGIDPERSSLFLQSQVREHTELAWVLAASCSYGDLTRMTQFKDKSAKQEFISAGLFTYPVLMAADIVVYKATHIPVGEDQKQHIELARDIAHKFNTDFGETFPLPEPMWTTATRVMSLSDPEKKMSKSAGDSHYVGVYEDEKSFRKKIQGAVTATAGGSEMAPGVKNLLTLLSQTSFPKSDIDQMAADDKAGKLRYGDLKKLVADNLLQLLAPIRERRKSLGERDARAALEKGAEKARTIARATMDEVRDKIGLVKIAR